jgi:hypothetical protein
MRVRFLDLLILLLLIDLFSLTLGFWKFIFLICARFIRFFLVSVLRSSVSRSFCAFLAFFSAVFAAFSRAVSSRAAVCSASFLAFFFAASRAFPSRAIVCCSFLSAVVRFCWSFAFSSAAICSRARATFAELKNKVWFFCSLFLWKLKNLSRFFLQNFFLNIISHSPSFSIRNILFSAENFLSARIKIVILLSI